MPHGNASSRRFKGFGMKKMRWYIYFADPSSSSRMRSVLISKRSLFIILVLTVFGTLGLGRCIYFGATYGYAKLGMHYNIKQNQQLQQKVLFLNRFAEEESHKISDLVSFEDKTRLKFGLEKISEDVRKAGVGGKPDNSELALATLGDPMVLKAHSIKETLEALLRQTVIQDSTFNRVATYVDQQSEMWKQRPSISPVWGRITSPFGYRIHPFTGAYILHEGLDISGTIGTPIKASADGIVSFVGVKENFGNVVIINHPASGFRTIFGHLQKAGVVEGQAVKRGDLVGYLGNTGRSTGPHLHYEIHKWSDLVNPMDYFIPTDSMVD
jgi:murein DD-endopeptidase MepM/ murein hydrolase activator NlpD